MLAAVSTIAFLAMVVTWAGVEPVRARMYRVPSGSRQVRRQTVQS